ncbi:MAG TPA: NUDIX hydrolase [Actinomycetota bacterium]
MTLIRAAGGLITRDGPEGPEVVLVHRPAYDDWSFPKGKLEPGEEELEAALREVLEETGLVGLPADDLGAITYVDGRGRPKVVRYWRMAPANGSQPRGDHEVDDARWIPLAEAGSMLTYQHDRALLRRLTGLPPEGPPVSVFVLRHTEAGERESWDEPDELRPISKAGLRQAGRVAEQLADVAFTRLVSSPYLRCIQSLEPIAQRRGLDITIAKELDEDEPPSGTEAWVLAASTDGPAALSTHGANVEGFVRRLQERDVPIGGDGTVAWEKGSVWRVDVQDGRITGATYIAPPP